MLATSARDLPTDEGEWATEIKWDGARALAFAADGDVILRSRSGRDMTSSYPEVAGGLVAAVGRRSLILDGELVAFEGNKPRFTLLQKRLHVSRPPPSLVAAVPVAIVVFDLLHQADRSLLRVPYEQRRALLEGLVLEPGPVLVPPAFPGEIRAVADASRQLELEGVIMKRLSSLYFPGRRSTDWRKVKNESYCR
jgi:bifunctional non-homologous end joining protein LigD